MSELDLVIIGDGPVMGLAASIAHRTRGGQQVRSVELQADQIGSTRLEFLENCDPSRTQLFAAIGVHALNYARFDLWAKIRFKGFRLVTLVHPTSDVDPSADIGENCLIGPFASIGPKAKIGRGSILLGRNDIAFEGRIGSFVSMATGARIGAIASVGSHVVLGENVVICDGVVVGDHCEISKPGAYQRGIGNGTFLSPAFETPARMVGHAWSTVASGASDGIKQAAELP